MVMYLVEWLEQYLEILYVMKLVWTKDLSLVNELDLSMVLR